MGWEKIFANDATDKEFIYINNSCNSISNKETNSPIKKVSRRLKQIGLQRRHIDGQQAYEKMLSITNY